ncbi:DUF1450 domain-containing protein [Fervidibacillus albus]|uniref:DUF1450 domain-containing protein n=1 Tax=Fervidibacillus albus TaxID=2980026 RepID=A0A9E8LW82_9BACI|nr:DUF1450 domain-containing protein [Fervidibacillus albus]WAA09924.1 DUF1450 domain-containing protein [Fervidibacillus albus]
MNIFSKRKKRKVYVCTNNLNHFYSDEQLEQLEVFAEHQQIDLEEMDCLGHCEECAAQPYVIINRNFIGAASPKQLLEKVTEFVSQRNASKK